MSEEIYVAGRLQCADSRPRFIRTGRALEAAARYLKTFRLKRCSSPAWGGAPMTDPSIADPPSPYSPALVNTPAPPPARLVAARTKLLLEGPVFATLLRLA